MEESEQAGRRNGREVGKVIPEKRRSLLYEQEGVAGGRKQGKGEENKGERNKVRGEKQGNGEENRVKRKEIG